MTTTSWGSAWPTPFWLGRLWHRYTAWRDRLPADVEERLAEWDRQFAEVRQAAGLLMERR